MQKGFTLIELLVVVLIMGILTAVAVPQYQLAVVKSRTVALLPLMKSIAQAQRLYYLEHGRYTDNFNKLTIEFPAGAKTVSALKLVYDNFSCETGFNEGNYDSLYCRDSKVGVTLEQYYGSDDTICQGNSNLGQKSCVLLCGRELNNRNACYF